MKDMIKAKKEKRKKRHRRKENNRKNGISKNLYLKEEKRIIYSTTVNRNTFWLCIMSFEYKKKIRPIPG
jgi:hypothetical protein